MTLPTRPPRLWQGHIPAAHGPISQRERLINIHINNCAGEISTASILTPTSQEPYFHQAASRRLPNQSALTDWMDDWLAGGDLLYRLVADYLTEELCKSKKAINAQQ